jgi:hypothetical protein
MTATEQNSTNKKVFTDIHDFLKEMAEVTNGLVDVQLCLGGERTVAVIAQDIWCLGYVMGFTDGICQWHKLDQYKEGMLLRALAFNRIFYGYATLANDDGTPYDGMKYVRKAIDNQSNAIYQIGTQKGLTDYVGMMQKNKSPMGLSEYLITKQHQQPPRQKSALAKIVSIFR